MERTQTFEGWGEIGCWGNNGLIRRFGYIKTEYFGDQAMLCLRTQQQPSCLRTLQKPEFVLGEWLRPGSIVRTEVPRQEFLVPVFHVAFVEARSEEECARNLPFRVSIEYRAGTEDQEKGRQTLGGAI